MAGWDFKAALASVAAAGCFAACCIRNLGGLKGGIREEGKKGRREREGEPPGEPAARS